MDTTDTITPETIRAFRAANPGLRPRDQAGALGISEAELLAASCGDGVTRIVAHPDKVMTAARQLGEVMALTRNDACVHEKIGVFDNYHSGNHAAMVLAEEIDLRIFPAHWRHAFMVEAETDAGPRRGLQVFDAAGDAVHKIVLRDSSVHPAWDSIRVALSTEDQSPTLVLEARQPPEPAKSRPERAEELRAQWRRMTDTHQFLRMVAKLRMNRLGAYRIAGPPFARALSPAAVTALLEELAGGDIDVMVFVGNRGCIQIHSGPIDTLKRVGPWQNVMDPRFNLHLRTDLVAEFWAVEKFTRDGPTTSVEAFDAEGGLIFQMFGLRKEGRDCRAGLAALAAGMPDAEPATAEALS